jgi:hypothetical protein
MDYMEEVPEAHCDITNNAFPNPAPGEMKKGTTQDPWKYHELSKRLYFQNSQGTTEYHRIQGTSGRSRNRGFLQAKEIDEAPSDTADTMI